MRIVVFGPPGVGKGTQCGLLTQWLSIPHLSTGQMLRDAKDDPVLGPEIARRIDFGNLVPDELVMRIIAARLSQHDCQSGALLDGFPRNVSQAESLDDHLFDSGDAIDLVLNLFAPDDVLIERLLRRAEIENRVDDNLETIRARLDVFRQQTRPVLEFYRTRRIVQDVDATQTPEQVFHQIEACVQAIR